MNDDKYLAAAIRVALKKGMICQSMEVDKKKSFRDGKSINGDICLFNRSGKEIGIIDRESIEKNEISFAKEEKENIFAESTNIDFYLNKFEDDDEPVNNYQIDQGFFDDLEESNYLDLPKSREKLTGLKLLRSSTQLYSQSLAETSICIRSG